MFSTVNHYVSVRAETCMHSKPLQLPTQTVLSVSWALPAVSVGVVSGTAHAVHSHGVHVFGTQGYSADARDNICDAARNTLESDMAF